MNQVRAALEQTNGGSGRFTAQFSPASPKWASRNANGSLGRGWKLPAGNRYQPPNRAI
ncbi:MAG: hypothetical protein FWG26_04885 [Betaproteobacteria bacterium]|nr:hypothetical protein [Betaproteobacteria bacterium]